MNYYRVTGKATVVHDCNCRHCIEPKSKAVDVYVIVRTGPDVDDEYIRSAGLRVAYREMGLIDETDDIGWIEGQEIIIREANQDEIMTAMGAPRLPGFWKGEGES